MISTQLLRRYPPRRPVGGAYPNHPPSYYWRELAIAMATSVCPETRVRRPILVARGDYNSLDHSKLPHGRAAVLEQLSATFPRYPKLRWGLYRVSLCLTCGGFSNRL
jgi:hypothetical protein